jgi:hypothetical protein
MSFLMNWDKVGEHFYETGISRGVLYPIDATKEGDNKYDDGVEWNGLTSVSESPEGAEVSAIYADNIKYLNLMSAEDFKGTIEAYTYPDKFAECDGSAELVAGVKIGQQPRKIFGLCYRTEIGNDETSEKGYKLHLVYNCLASPSERSYETVNDSPEAITFSWEFSTTPVNVTGHKPTAVVTIDSTKLTPAKLKALENILYGVAKDAEHQEEQKAKLLLPDEIVAELNKVQ